MPATKPKLEFRGNLHHSELVDSWCLPFMGSDKSVMTRTVRSLYHDKGHRSARSPSISNDVVTLQANSDKLLCSVPVNLQVSDVDVGGNCLRIVGEFQLGQETAGELSRSLHVR